MKTMTVSCSGAELNLLTQLIATQPPTDAMDLPRPAGRQRTRTAGYYQNLLRDYESARCWFSDTFARPPRSDMELLRGYLMHELQRQSRRSSAVNSPEVVAKLKTLRNNLALARKQATALASGANENDWHSA